MDQHTEIVVDSAVNSERAGEQLRQVPELFMRVASTMEHDFNDVVTVISSYSELLLNKTPQNDPRHSYIQRIQNATRKAAKIGDALFAFPRLYAMRTEVLEFDAVLADLIPTLREIAGKQRQVNYSAGPGPKTVFLAPGYVTRIITASVAAVCDGITLMSLEKTASTWR